jgi:signal transduction histidine kinase
MSDVATEGTSLQRWQRRLLPGELVRESRAQRSPRDWLVDSALFVFAVAGGVATLVESWDDHGTLLLVADVVAGSAACLGLWWRRSYPVAIGILAVAAGAFSALATVAAPLAVFGAAVRAPRRALVAITGLAVVAIVTFNLLYPSIGDFPSQTIFGLLVLLVAIGFGLLTRVRRELVLSLRDRAERLEADQRLQVEQARDAERRRIAREMHDVLAHRLSLLSVHAGALEFRPDASPGEVSEAAGVIRATAHSALEDLRDVIGVLRDDGEEGPQPPQPTFGQIPALVDESRAAGMNICLTDDSSADPEIPSALGRTAYRVVQEGLTNARKHAPGAAVEVRISTDEAHLLVEVVSRPPVGRGGRLAQAGTGTGLVGLRERVELTGGELRSGRDANGDFVLRATLSWPP